MAGTKRPIQATDANANPLTSFAEGAIDRIAIPADGKWHLVPRGAQAVRLHVFDYRKGILYTTSRAAAVVDGDAVTDHVANSIPVASGRIVLLTFAGATDLFLAADPDGAGAALIVAVCQNAGA